MIFDGMTRVQESRLTRKKMWNETKTKKHPSVWLSVANKQLSQQNPAHIEATKWLKWYNINFIECLSLVFEQQMISLILSYNILN